MMSLLAMMVMLSLLLFSVLPLLNDVLSTLLNETERMHLLQTFGWCIDRPSGPAMILLLLSSYLISLY